MHGLVGAAVVMWLGVSTAHAAATIHELAGRAGTEARRLRSDARLVQIEVPIFSLAMGTSGLPDMSRVGPPAAVVFHYLSASTQRQIRVVLRPDLPPAQRGSLQAEELTYRASPYSLPIPDGFVELDHALARAQEAGFARECAGVNVHYGCGRVVRAELHAYAAGQGTAGIPIWTFTFGQDANARTITRQVDGVTGRVVRLEEQAARGTDHPDVVPLISPVFVRVQLSEQENAPAVSSIRDGQSVWLFLKARVNTGAVEAEACFVFVSRSNGEESGRNCKKSDLSADAGAIDISYRLPVKPHLPASLSADVLVITGSVTANGVTEQGHTSVEVRR